MNHRFLVLVGGLVVPAAVTWLSTMPVAGQAGSAGARTNGRPAKAYTAPHTPDGQPDLQGIWSNTTITPLERPKNVTREFFTAEEALEAAKRAAAEESEQTEPGTVADVHYDFTQFGLDRSQSAMALNLRTSLIVDPGDGRLPPLSAEGQRRAAERAAARKSRGGTHDAVQNEPLGSRCILMDRNGPPMLGGAYNNDYQIMQAPGYVMILTEMLHDVRVIPLDGRPHLPPNVRQWTGSYRGHWDGQTLVLSGGSTAIDVGERTTPEVSGQKGATRLLRGNAATRQRKSLLVFVTPTVIDPAGNRVHSPEDFPIRKNSVPPQKPATAK